MNNYVRRTPVQQTAWKRTQWNDHTTLPAELQAVKNRLLSLSLNLSTVKPTVNALHIQQPQGASS